MRLDVFARLSICSLFRITFALLASSCCWHQKSKSILSWWDFLLVALDVISLQKRQRSLQHRWRDGDCSGLLPTEFTHEYVQKAVKVIGFIPDRLYLGWTASGSA